MILMLARVFCLRDLEFIFFIFWLKLLSLEILILHG
jgi:hypothetical protein